MIPIVAIFNIPKSKETAYHIYKYKLMTYKERSGIKCVKVLIDNIKAVQNTAIAFVFLHQTCRSEEHLVRLVELFNNQQYSFNDERRIVQARIELNETKEYNSSNTRNSNNADIVVVTYQTLGHPKTYHTDHRSLANDLATLEQQERPSQSNETNNGSTNDQIPLAVNLATPEEIDDENHGSTCADDAKLATSWERFKSSPDDIEAIFREPRRHQNLELIAARYNLVIADDIAEAIKDYNKSIL
jgi:hypothetical protein